MSLRLETVDLWAWIWTIALVIVMTLGILPFWVGLFFITSKIKITFNI